MIGWQWHQLDHMQVMCTSYEHIIVGDRCCERELSCVLVGDVGPPTIIQGETTQTVTVDEFDNVNLTCAATGYPTPNISWVRVNGNVLPPPYNRFAVKVVVLTFSVSVLMACRHTCTHGQIQPDFLLLAGSVGSSLSQVRSGKIFSGCGCSRFYILSAS